MEGYLGFEVFVTPISQKAEGQVTLDDGLSFREDSLTLKARYEENTFYISGSRNIQPDGIDEPEEWLTYRFNHVELVGL